MNMLKRILLCGICCILLIFATACSDNNGDNSKKPDYDYRVTDSGDIIITACLKDFELLEIPSEIDGRAVVGIADNAFFNYQKATEIIIPEGILEIGVSAFENCTNLRKITIAKSVEAIKEKAFSNCIKLKSVVLKNDSALSLVGENAFESCRSLDAKNYEGANYLQIGDNQYGALLSATSTKIDKVTIHEDTQIIVGSAFKSCESITEITIPEGLKYIGDKAFYGCINLTRIYFNAIRMKDLLPGSAVFERVAMGKKDMTITIGPKVERIPSYLMDSATRLRILKFDDNAICDTIGEYAFAGTPLPDITIPKCIKKIENGAFAECTWLVKVTLDAENLEDFASDNNIFINAGISDTDTSHISTLLIARNAKKIPAYFASSTNFEIIEFDNDSACESIGKQAFMGSSISTIDLPRSLNRIDDGAFLNCSSLKRVKLSSDISDFSADNKVFLGTGNSVDGIRLLIGTNVTRIPSYFASSVKYLDEIIFDEITNITDIGTGAFLNCENIRKISITDKSAWCRIRFSNAYSNPLYYGNAVIYIGDTMASNGLKFEKIDYISDYAFIGYRKNLNKLILPIELKHIGTSAFENVTELNTVYYEGTAEDWNNIIIDSGNDYLTNSKIYFYSEATPTSPGNYWYFSESGTPIIWSYSASN